MITGATYREGVALTADGAVYVHGLASGSVAPATATKTPGSGNSPLAGKMLTDQGAIYVRFV